MKKLEELLKKQVNRELQQIILSNPKKKEGVSKVKVRPFLMKEKLLFQVEEFQGKQAFHKNLEKEELETYICNQMTTEFKQFQLESKEVVATALVSKKGTVTLKIKKQEKRVESVLLEHNKKKRYLLEEGKVVDFLVDLGVMTLDGKVVKAHYDKFRQINRFLEFIDDIIVNLPKGRELTILDFGCGKSYLTFAMYYYLKICKDLDIRIIGLDLKEEVIDNCSELAKKYGYEKLQFLKGDIADYEGVNQVDMVVTLHACDTATDYALYKAVKWGASVILSVPCCQHELNKQIKNEVLDPVFGYGLLKERMAALITDGLRGQLLEQQGYDTQILEFIDMEHTPKNILIRAVKRKNGKKDSSENYKKCAEFLQVSSTLEKLLEEGMAEH